MSNHDSSLVSNIKSRLDALQTQINTACNAASRMPQSLALLAVSKTHTADMVYAAYQCGLRDFGENYVLEGVEKIIALQQLVGKNTLNWHFIGPLQSNKTRIVAEHFDWVDSVERLKIAQRLSEQRPTHLPPLNICVQVNISLESSKSGCLPAEALDLALRISELPNIQLRGLMAIPAPLDNAAFVAMAQLHHDIKSALPLAMQTAFDTLSIGMSDDFPQAIAAGSTMIRIGSALFGARETPHKE